MSGIFDNAQSIMIGNKEVTSIKIGENSLYEKETIPSERPAIKLYFTNISSLSEDRYIIYQQNNTEIDYGDGTVSTGKKLSHTYSSVGDYEVKLYDAYLVRRGSMAQFNQNLIKVSYPAESTSLIWNDEFYGCKSIQIIEFGWNDPPMTFNSGLSPSTFSWYSCNYVVPKGSLQNYIDKGFPSNQLVERNE